MMRRGGRFLVEGKDISRFHPIWQDSAHADRCLDISDERKNFPVSRKCSKPRRNREKRSRWITG